jgi:magnesium-transporting ATPase (P-type)
MTYESVIEDLKTDLKKGLTTHEAEERIAKYGDNTLEKEEETSLWERIKESFEDLLVRILLIAATVSFIIAITGIEFSHVSYFSR